MNLQLCKTSSAPLPEEQGNPPQIHVMATAWLVCRLKSVPQLNNWLTNLANDKKKGGFAAAKLENSLINPGAALY